MIRAAVAIAALAALAPIGCADELPEAEGTRAFRTQPVVDRSGVLQIDAPARWSRYDVLPAERFMIGSTPDDPDMVVRPGRAGDDANELPGVMIAASRAAAAQIDLSAGGRRAHAGARLEHYLEGLDLERVCDRGELYHVNFDAGGWHLAGRAREWKGCGSGLTILTSALMPMPEASFIVFVALKLDADQDEAAYRLLRTVRIAEQGPP